MPKNKIITPTLAIGLPVTSQENKELKTLVDSDADIFYLVLDGEVLIVF